MSEAAVILLIVAAVFVFTLLLLILSRYRKCPSDKVLVIYGKVGSNSDGSPRSAKCIHGGAAFIWPVFQSFQYMDLTPMTINVELTKALSQQNIRVDVPSRFTVGISTETGVMQNAAERLLGLKTMEIQELARDIMFGQLRLVIATMAIEEINTDRDKFLEAVSHNVETELKKIGLRLINVNVTDINDESGYIEALGKEAAAKAINDAKQSVAEKNRDGSIGASKAVRDERISVAASDAKAVEGENESKAFIAQSDATRREMEAEALRRATAAERTAEARALEEAYAAQRAAEQARADRDAATGQADVIVNAKIAKERKELEAESDAEQTRRRAQGDADAIYSRMEAQARGIQEILEKQATGFGKVVDAAGGDPNAAVQLMIADKLEDLVKIQVEAIKNLQIDKITVWDSMSGDGGSPTTSNFLSGMMRSIPPLNEMFKMAGMTIPGFLGSDAPAEVEETSITVDEVLGEDVTDDIELVEDVEVEG
ncbi:MAG: SPFH domain-containing protein [Oscillospiraceae bacterium]|nr:SPFH domain-containing protein [Oscillospiraceae bacterium]